MIKNYFITAFRNFWRDKAFSVINVMGLSIGISAALVIFLIVYYEFGYDKFQPGGDRIYRIVIDSKYNGMDGYSAAVPAPLANAIQREVTGVEQTVPVMTFQGDGNATVSIANEGADKPVVFKKQTDVVFTNPQYFYLMPHHWVAGSPIASLKDPFHVVLSESRAKQYFPSLPASDIIGKAIKYNDDITVTVSGVVKDLNEPTTLTAVEFISYTTITQTHLQDDFMMNVWNDWMAYSQLYIKVTAGNDELQIEKQLASLLAKYNKDANKDAANTMAFKLQPLSDVHFNDHYAAFNQRVAHMSTLYGLLAIAAFLLLLGCINFINLTTANATQRAKEIGIRKTMGSSKKQLVLQFLGETFLITLIATIISVAITPLLLSLFKDFIPPGLQFNLIQQPYIFLFLFLLTVFVSFVSGLYPAMILSGYKPVIVLKSQAFANSGETRHAWVRKTLTVSQFVIAQFFIIATMMVSKQISYSLNADMGFKKDAIVNFNLPGSWKDSTAKSKGEVFMNKLSAMPGITNASKGFLSPATEGAAFGNISYTDSKKEIKENVQVRWGDEHYLDVYQIKLVAGRNVKPVDSVHECLINEAYAKTLGFTDPRNALDRQLNWNETKYTIVGVMHDFHQHSTHLVIGPVVFKYGSGDFVHIALRPDSKTWSKTIASIEKEYKTLYPEEDFNYTFFDETIAKFYTEERNTAKLLTWSTGLAVLISCLGLLGLVMYTINTRTKEIGIRKILGASVTNILTVLSTDFVKLVCIAFLIAAPLAWWAIYKWLEDFAYRTAMSWWVFVLAGAFMLLLALITLSMQTIKAAIANPVKSLRTE
jgi:putative ABC transport system permease protein